MYGLPKTREEARQVGSKAYFTGLFCKQGHVAKRWTATGNCAECQKNRTKQWTNANPEKVRAYLYTPEMLEKRREYGRNYYNKNKAIFIEKDAKRRAKELLATTVWGQENVRAFYKKAKELEALNSGIKYHVDHIVPLVGANVCGLHNHFNLQILTETENKRKGNAWYD
jgi:5-methylcytosine-specific restriction endonuclease McrA